MKAVRVHEFGDESVLRYEDAPDPTAGPGEIVIRVRAAGLNRGDLNRRAGGFGAGQQLPLIIGWDVAGDVQSVGPDVTDFQPGQRVVSRLLSGGYAELAPALAERTALLPDKVTYEQGAALPVAYLSALAPLKVTANMQPGETVLIQSASSGVSMAAIQLAKLYGAGKVITTTSSPEKAAKAKELGADVVIDYTKEDFVPAVLKETDGRGVDIIIEVVGGETFSKSQSVLAEGGRLIAVGRSSGQPAVADEELAKQKNQTVLPAWRLDGTLNGPESARELAGLANLVAEGKLKAVIDKVFPLSQVADAHRYLAGRNQFGKVILKT